MKKVLAYGLAALVGVTALTGCGEEQRQANHERQIECLEMTGDKYCRNEYEQQADAQRRTAYSRSNVVYGPSAPGMYTNYYGNPDYGYWGNDGMYMFNDPYSSYAQSTNSFLLGAGLGGLATYAMTRDTWDNDHRDGWTETTRENKTYRGKNGKKISKAEFSKRKAQSKKDKAAHKAKLKAKQKAKKPAVKKAQINKANTKVNSTQKSKNDALKAKLKAKQAAKKDNKANKPTIGSKLGKNEQKVKNNALKAKLKAKQANKGKKGISSGQKMKNNDLKAKLKAKRAAKNKPQVNKVNTKVRTPKKQTYKAPKKQTYKAPKKSSYKSSSKRRK